MRLDDEATWPERLLRLLNDNLPTLRAYERERAEHDRRCRHDVMARLDATPHPHAAARDAVLAECHETVLDRSIVGFHCTRLTDEEKAEVERDGLRPLSPELFEGRIASVLRQGLIDRAVADALLERNDCRQENRAGMVWFAFRSRELADESGVGRFFRYWGGEALYGRHEADPATAPALRSLGVPCIVEAAVPASGIETFAMVGERVMRIFLKARGVGTGSGDDMEGYVREPVPGAFVLRVVPRGHPDFARLTRIASWRQPLD
ncbi:hypothetical protein [Methylobacterium sp. ARG-1]|uniref:hypothetical protein n=1 Tax=Methylobacterium sp. ARG-1 TaxID=1692501 RepID=UPI000683355B|nr:hypothetical protein [Methylobacterium sp. ARG-1]